MSDTPETDDQPIIYAINDNGYQVPCVDIEYARKLERERDKARTELEMWRDGNIMHQIHRDELEKTERERDEAREAFKEIWRSGDAFLPHVDSETINRWRKAAGWDYAK